MFEFMQATNEKTLSCAWEKIRRKHSNYGIDGIGIEFYEANLDVNLGRLRFALANDMYAPYSEMVVGYKNRDIYISCIEDKIVQTVIASILHTVYTFPACVHSFIKGRSIYTAQAIIKKALRENPALPMAIVDIDKFYESIDKNILLEMMSMAISDKRFLQLTAVAMKSSSAGISTGSCLSPVLSNIYLEDFDRTMTNSVAFYTRYVDDMLVAIPEAEIIAEGTGVPEALHSNLAKLNLSVNKSKLQIIRPEEPFSFLGFEFKRDVKELEVESLIMEKRFSDAEKAYESHSVVKADEGRGDMNEDAYPEVFFSPQRTLWMKGEEGRFGKKNSGYSKIDILRLLGNGYEIAADVLRQDGQCDFAVFDIDINRQIILEHGEDTALFSELTRKSFDLAVAISDRVENEGLFPYIEFSGYKGYHVWVFWEQGIETEKTKAFFNAILSNLDIPAGIHVERFPACKNSNQKIKLPYSVHSISGKRSFFIDRYNKKMGLEELRAIKNSCFREIVKEETPNENAKGDQKESATQAPPHILEVEKRCSYINAIVKKAKEESYLNYHEKNVLLHTFGALGEEGAKHIHRILSHCMDYNYKVTAQNCEKASGLYPLGCKKLMERFEDQFPECNCGCVFDLPKMYPSPVCHAIKMKSNCYVPPDKKEKLGHFKTGSPKGRINELIVKYAEITRKNAELRQMQTVCEEQLSLLFERCEAEEMDTDMGRLVKQEDGYYLRLGC